MCYLKKFFWGVVQGCCAGVLCGCCAGIAWGGEAVGVLASFLCTGAVLGGMRKHMCTKLGPKCAPAALKRDEKS